MSESPSHQREPLPERRRRIRRRRIEAGGIGAVVASAAVAAGLIIGSNSSAGQDHGDASAASVPSPSRNLSDHVLAGQRVIAGFDGTTVPHSIHKAVKKGLLGGVILFDGNLGSRADIRSLTHDLQAIPRPAGLRHTPLLIMTDQEGGEVKRLSGAPATSAAGMGEKGGHYSKKQGEKTGRNLKNAGVNVDLAPVLDVARPDGVISETERGFGSTASQVKKTAVPFAQGLQKTGIAATAKHFPGLGSISINTDDAAQSVNLSKAAIRKVDEAPYRTYIKAGGDMVMVGTASYPAFDDKPAAFSKTIVQGELRDRLGFDGVTITDSLESVAADAFGSQKKVAVAGARAGMDLLLFGSPASAREGEDAIAKKLHSGSLKRRDFRESVDRIIELRQNLGA